MEKERMPVILVADDAPEIRSMLGIRLSKMGYKVVEAGDGNQALEMVRQHFPDLVILDVMMPLKNGWEVARELRRDVRFKEIGIIILTAIGETISDATSPLYGADDHINKPFDFKDLEDRVQKVLAKKRQA